MLTAKVFYPVGREIRVYELSSLGTAWMRRAGRRGVELMRGHGAAARAAFMRGVATADYVVPVVNGALLRAKMFAITDDAGLCGFGGFVEGRVGRACEGFGLCVAALEARGVGPANQAVAELARFTGVGAQTLDGPGVVFFAMEGAPVEYIAAMLLAFAEGLRAAGEQEVAR